MIITQTLLDQLSEQAKSSPRLWMNLDLRNLVEDNSQRMLSPNGPNVAVDIPAGQWHSIHSIESGSVVLSCKDGKWEPLGEEDMLS